MNCTDCKEKLVQYLEGLMPEPQRQTIEEHLKDCHLCRAEFKELKNLSERITSDSRALRQTNLEDEVFNRIMRLQNEKLKQADMLNRQSKIWRKIMKSKITKLTAAAIIIIAVLAVMHHFGGSIDGTSVAWADVIEQINEFRPYVCKLTFKYDGDRPDDTHTVMYMTLSRRREIRNQGKLIQVFDMSQRPVRILVLYPDRKVARETLLLDRGPTKDPDMLRIIAGRQNGTEEDLGLDKINGKTVKIFHSPDQHNEFTVWADVETNLPVWVELRQSSSGRTIIMEDFEFVVEFDESLFDTTAPEDYAVDRVEMAGKETVIKQENLAQKADFEAYVLSTRPAWTKEPRIMEVSNVMGIGEDIYMTFAIADDGRHVVLMQSQMMSKMLLSKIRTGQLVYTSSKGLKVYRGGPEKWYSNILLESVGNVLPDKPSPDRTGCAIESPSGMVILIAFNGPVTDDELFNIAESLVPAAEYLQ